MAQSYCPAKKNYVPQFLKQRYINSFYKQIWRTDLRRSLQQSQSNSGTLGQWERSPFTRVFRPENNKINNSSYYFLPITFTAINTLQDTGASQCGPIKQKQK
jgi:hypothetical protein